MVKTPASTTGGAGLVPIRGTKILSAKKKKKKKSHNVLSLVISKLSRTVCVLCTYTHKYIYIYTHTCIAV